MLHTHRAPTLQFWVQAQIFGRHEATRMWTALPLFWTAGLNTAMGSTLAAGGCWVMQETFEPGAALALMARERVTEPYTLPHQTARARRAPRLGDHRPVVAARACSASRRSPATRPSPATPSWQMPVGYGLSETVRVLRHATGATRRASCVKQSMGRLLPGNELRVVDPDTGAVLGPNEDGELAIKGPTLMQHYLGRSTATSASTPTASSTPATPASSTPTAYVHFTGRRTEMIKTGGANVSPAELEVQLRACPPVKLARIVGVPDARLDQLVVACITLKDGADATEDDIQAFLRERVAAYKVPKRVLFFADGEIPMTGSDTKVRDDRAARARRGTPQSEHERMTTDGNRRSGLDASDLDQYMGVPMEPGELKEPGRRSTTSGAGCRAMHYPNPLHYDEQWAAESRFGAIVAPQSFTVATDTSHGCSPAQVGKIPNSHLIFGGDDWWFFGPRI